MDTDGTFFIGEKEFNNQKILMLTNDKFAGFPTDGILGYSIFGNFAVEINYDEKYLILHEFDSFVIDDSWTKIPIYFKQNTIPWIDVEIQINSEEPIKISTYIDFAAGETIELLEKPKQKFKKPKSVEKVHLGTGLSGEIYGTHGNITELNCKTSNKNKLISNIELNNLRDEFIKLIKQTNGLNVFYSTLRLNPESII